MTTIDQHYDEPVKPVPSPTGNGVRWRLVGLVGLVVVVVVAVIGWVLNGSAVDRWLAVHLGTDDLSGPWYGFWSGFGSDLAELGIIGAIATGVYQLVRKYNCHEPGCWRVGTHPAADGQFLLCYRHHPDFNGKKPTHEVIERMHREHLAHTAALHDRLHEIQAQLKGPQTGVGSNGPST